MPAVKSPALVLHTFPYGDTSRILRVLTPELGVRSLIAKGARSPKSRFGAVLEPFSEGEAQFNLREGVELHTLSGFSLTRSRQGIGRSLEAFAAASVIAEVALHAGTEEASPLLYELLSRSFDRLADGTTGPLDIAIPALWSLVTILGFRPETRFCVRCGEPVPELLLAHFDVEAGGTICTRCGSSGPLLDALARSQIEEMCDDFDPASDLSRPPLHLTTVTAFLRAHVLVGRSLRSLPLLLEQVEGS